MQPLYTEAEFQAAKSRQTLPLQCLHCTQTFYKTKHEIKNVSNANQKLHISCNFCSNSCQNSHQRPPVFVECVQCHKPFKKRPSQINKSPRHFCSHSCHATWHNAHKTTGTRVSKLEVWLSKQLPMLYPNLEFHFNRTDAINAELDIYIPSIHLAFELNGIFHYIPVFGQDKLAKMQNNDARKVQACIESQINLCVIDVYSHKYFKEQADMKFLEIIQNIINDKLSGSSPVAHATA